MFLWGSKIRGKSLKHPLGIYPAITPEALLPLVERLKAGDSSVISDIIKGHLALLLKIAGQYSAVVIDNGDFVSVGLLGMLEGCLSGKLQDSNITTFLACRAHAAIGNHVRANRLIKGGKKVVPLDHSDLLAEDRPLLEIEELLAMIIKTPLEQQIVDLRKQGYTVREIAARLGCSKSFVDNQLSLLHRRFKELYED